MTLGTYSRTATGLGGSEEASETPLSRRQNIFLPMPKYISHAAWGAISDLTQTENDTLANVISSIINTDKTRVPFWNPTK